MYILTLEGSRVPGLCCYAIAYIVYISDMRKGLYIAYIYIDILHISIYKYAIYKIAYIYIYIYAMVSAAILLHISISDMRKGQTRPIYVAKKAY